MTVAPYDEPELAGDDIVIRRINPIEHVVDDDNRKCRRISSKAYKPSSEPNGGMSVDVELLMIAAEIDARSYVTTSQFTGAVALVASAIRDLDLRVGYDPLPSNPYHGEVWGKGRPNKFTNAQNCGLAKAAKWFVAIPDVDLI